MRAIDSNGLPGSRRQHTSSRSDSATPVIEHDASNPSLLQDLGARPRFLHPPRHHRPHDDAAGRPHQGSRNPSWSVFASRTRSLQSAPQGLRPCGHALRPRARGPSGARAPCGVVVPGCLRRLDDLRQPSPSAARRWSPFQSPASVGLPPAGSHAMQPHPIPSNRHVSLVSIRWPNGGRLLALRGSPALGMLATDTSTAGGGVSSRPWLTDLPPRVWTAGPVRCSLSISQPPRPRANLVLRHPPQGRAASSAPHDRIPAASVSIIKLRTDPFSATRRPASTRAGG
ncbi:hypothetical protein AURDEDRAFT_115798 [Auricularia subglabra TFB-10046 SS5]|nr:hypothetical protein AURDEDRAFT_115798 [Auricularia subglabra TFB-10046 SS5]